MSISVLEALQPAKKPALLGLVAVLGLLAGVWVHGKYYSDRSPVQPIEFSHTVHVTDNEIPCQHCHIYAATTPVAGVPSVSKCVGPAACAAGPTHMLISNRNPERISILMIRFYAPVGIESATKRTEVTATAQARESIGRLIHSAP